MLNFTLIEGKFEEFLLVLSQKLGKHRWAEGLCPLVARYLRKEELELSEADPGLPLLGQVPHLPYRGAVFGGACFVHLAEAGQTLNG
jgi:hypothetical protein